MTVVAQLIAEVRIVPDVKPEEKPSTSSPKEIRIGADAWMVEKLKINEAAKQFEANHEKC